MSVTVAMKRCTHRRHVLWVGCGEHAALRFAVAVTEQLHMLQLSQSQLRICQVAHCHWLHGVALTHVDLGHPVSTILITQSGVPLSGMPCQPFQTSQRHSAPGKRGAIGYCKFTPDRAIPDNLVSSWWAPNTADNKGLLADEELHNGRDVWDVSLSGFRQHVGDSAEAADREVRPHLPALVCRLRLVDGVDGVQRTCLHMTRLLSCITLYTFSSHPTDMTLCS